MKKRILTLGLVCILFCPLALFLYLIMPVSIYSTTNKNDYLKVHKLVSLFLEDEDYFLPNCEEVMESDNVSYSYIYEPESWYMDQFCIHLAMDQINIGTRNEYLKQVKQYTTFCSHLESGEDIWLSKETEASIKEKLNTNKWNDGRILFFYIVVVSEPTSSFDFWVCKLEDTGRSISAEFDSLIEKINPLLSDFR